MKKAKLVTKRLISLAVTTAMLGTTYCTSVFADEEKVINVANSETNISWDPIKVPGAFGVMVNGNIYANLYSKDPSGQFQLELADSVDVSEDGLTYTFHIRDDAYWSTGDPVTADDFVFAWRRVSDPSTGSECSNMVELLPIENGTAITNGEMPAEELGVYAQDDKTFVVQLIAPCGYAESMFASPFLSPVNESYYEEIGADNYFTTVDNIAYCGPYYLSEWDSASNTVTLRKNNDYWDADNIDIDVINFKLVEDAQSGVMAYESGLLDYVKLTGNMVQQYVNDDEYIEFTGDKVWYLYFNAEQITNKTLRQALAYAINREDIVNNILKDGSFVKNDIICKSIDVNSEGVDFTDDAEDLYVFDPQKAAELWEQAKQEGCQTSLTLLYDTDDLEIPIVAQYLDNQLEQLLPGLTIELQQVTKNTRVDTMMAGDYEVALNRWGPDYEDASTTLALYETGFAANWAAWSNEEFDKLLAASVTTDANDEEARWEDMLKAEYILNEDAISVPIYQTGSTALLRNTVHNMHQHLCGTQTFWKYVTMD